MTTHTQACTCDACELFQLGEALNVFGDNVEAYGISVNGMFIVNPYATECGRFACAPSTYGLTDAQALHLARLNAGRDLLSYWDI
jgi:hypothetical protein